MTTLSRTIGTLVLVCIALLNISAEKLTKAEEQIFLFAGENSLTELFFQQCMPYAEAIESNWDQDNADIAFELARSSSVKASQELGYEHRSQKNSKQG